MPTLLAALLPQHTPLHLTSAPTPPTFPTAPTKSDEPAIPDPAVFTVTPLNAGGTIAAVGPPTVSQCAVHLELLQAFSRLRHRVVKEAAFIEIFGTVDEERDTWWGAFVEVAVGRFGTWWWGVEEELRKREEECGLPVPAPVPVLGKTESAEGSPGRKASPGLKGEKAAMVVESQETITIRELPQDLLPPLDVLMVWHSYLLGPRTYAEDAIHHRLPRILATAFPWAHIHAAINTDTFSYTLPDAAARFFERLTNQSPRLLDELLWKDVAPRKSIACPACAAPASPVRICDAERKGGGWMDVDFTTVCAACGATIDKPALCAEKLRREIGEFVKAGPGARMRMTNMDALGRTRAECPPGDEAAWASRDFVNDLFRRTFSAAPPLTAADSIATLSARLHDNLPTDTPAEHTAALTTVLAAFSGTPHRFSTDLTAAVLRQGTFVAKMNDKLWLRSPGLIGRLPPAGAARARLAPTRSCVVVAADGDGFLKRAVARYEAFFELFRRYPGRLLVPTLDVDLAWHTSILTAVGYRAWCVQRAGRFVGHDDTIGAGALEESFSFTESVYSEVFGAVWGRCCCWYCEAAVSEGVEAGGKRWWWRGERGGARREREVRVRVEFYREVERRRRAGEAGLAWGGLWEALGRR